MMEVFFHWQLYAIVSTLYNIAYTAFVYVCLFVYYVSRMQCTFLNLDPGVPYNITVRASTAVGKGEPVSIVVFAEQEGKLIIAHVHRIVMRQTCV